MSRVPREGPVEPSPKLIKAAALGASGGAAVLGGRLTGQMLHRHLLGVWDNILQDATVFQTLLFTGTASLVSLKALQKWFCSNYQTQSTIELSGGNIHVTPRGPLQKRAKAMGPITGLFIHSFLFEIFPPSTNHAGWANTPLALLTSDR